MFYDFSYSEILGDGDKYKTSFSHSYINILPKVSVLTSLAVQWLGLHAFTRKGTGSIPGQGNKISQTAGRPQPKNIICVS